MGNWHDKKLSQEDWEALYKRYHRQMDLVRQMSEDNPNIYREIPVRPDQEDEIKPGNMVTMDDDGYAVKSDGRFIVGIATGRSRVEIDENGEPVRVDEIMIRGSFTIAPDSPVQLAPYISTIVRPEKWYQKLARRMKFWTK